MREDRSEADVEVTLMRVMMRACSVQYPVTAMGAGRREREGRRRGRLDSSLDVGGRADVGRVFYFYRLLRTVPVAVQ